ncbi:MAG: glycolate oxidase subunit GlcF [Pseudomonadota bacterium]
MQTSIIEQLRNTAAGKEADAILRSCVHCGFCTATCPTYQLLGDELDGPRGRIYLIKQMLEGNEVTEKTQLHLDRCLTCRSCETTCPSGVKYGRLVEIGREVVEERVGRSWPQRVIRKLLRMITPYPARLKTLVRLGGLFKPLLPVALKAKLPNTAAHQPWPAPRHARRMLVLQGCAQEAVKPSTNAATARVLDRLGISLIAAPEAGCCGAVSYHLNAHEEGLNFMRRNIDAWWPAIEAGAEAIVMTASGCGAMVKDYGELLRHDPAYAAKAARVASLTKDLSEILAKEDLSVLGKRGNGRRIAFQTPCTLQHAQKLNGVVEGLLRQVGFELTPVPDGHLCCGSAGTYSVLQSELSQRLLQNKLAALESGKPELIATANIGCHMHLETQAKRPVKHWIEVLDAAL